MSVTLTDWLAACPVEVVPESAQPPRSPFAALLRAYRERAGLSRYGLAQRVSCDASALWNLEHERRLPSRGMVLKLGVALGLVAVDAERLLLTAGYCPNWMMALAGVARVTPREVAVVP